MDSGHMPISRREMYFENGRVTIECPRLMSDEELADVLAVFVETVRARPPKASVSMPREQPSSVSSR
jgi:hypothetical protein